MIKSLILNYFKTKNIEKIRIFSFNNAYRLDQFMILSILIFVYYFLLKTLYLSGFFSGQFILKAFLSAIAFFINILIFIKFFPRSFNIFHGLIRHFFIINGDKISFIAPDERKFYTGIYLNLSENEIKNYIKNMGEKKLGFSKFSINNIVGSMVYIDLGAGLFAKIPYTSISKIIK